MQGESIKTTNNLFSDCGISQADIDKRINDTFHAIFDDQQNRFYFDLDENTSYIMDTGNNDARSEGIS